MDESELCTIRYKKEYRKQSKSKQMTKQHKSLKRCNQILLYHDSPIKWHTQGYSFLPLLTISASHGIEQRCWSFTVNVLESCILDIYILCKSSCPYLLPHLSELQHHFETLFGEKWHHILPKKVVAVHNDKTG